MTKTILPVVRLGTLNEIIIGGYLLTTIGSQLTINSFFK